MLVACDMKIRNELTPWVAGVYVAAEERGKGIGAALVQRVTEEAKALGHERIYLFTFDAEKYYARIGWQLRERAEYLGVGVAVMEMGLSGVSDVSDEEALRRDAEMEGGKVKPMTQEEFVMRVEKGRKRK